MDQDSSKETKLAFQANAETDSHFLKRRRKDHQYGRMVKALDKDSAVVASIIGFATDFLCDLGQIT